MSLSGNSSIVDEESVPDCSYYECKNLPTVMLEKCQNNGCTNHQHHLCQVAYQERREIELGMSIPMFKRCHNCLEKFIEEKLEKKEESVGNNQSGGGGGENGGGGGENVPNASIQNISPHNVTIPNVPNVPTQNGPNNLIPTADGSNVPTTPIHSNLSNAPGVSIAEQVSLTQNASSAPTSNAPTSNAPIVLDSTGNVGNAPNGSPSCTAAQFSNFTNFSSDSFSANHANVPDVATPATKRALPAQTGFKGCSGMFDEKVYLFPKYESVLNTVVILQPSYAMGKVVCVPNTKKGINYYDILYDKKHHTNDEIKKFTTQVTATKAIKEHLKEAFGRADRECYRFGGVQKARQRKKPKTAAEATPVVRPGTILIPGIMHERNLSSHASQVQVLVQKEDADEESNSDEDSNYDINDCAFLDAEETPDIHDEPSDGEEEINVMGPGWKWDRWEDIGIDDDIPGPELVDPYNGPHGLRPGISTSFTTVLQCIFVCSAMDQDFFKRLTANSIKYARARMAEKSTTLFIGRKWTNITWGEMVRFFGILLRISMEPRRMGGTFPIFKKIQW